MTLALTRSSDPLAQATALLHADDQTRRRAAVTAARDADVDGLWQVVYAHHLEVSGGRVSPQTLTAYRAGLAVFVAWAGERGVMLLRPGPRAGARFVADLTARGLSPATVKARTAAARKLYEALRACDATGADPFAGARMPADPTPSIHKRPPYRVDQVQALLEHSPLPIKALILLCAHAGLRSQEALDLTWTQVNLQSREVTVHGKGGKTRRVPLSLPCVQVLGSLFHADEYVLPWRAYSTVRDILYRVSEEAGVEWRGFHAARKHAGTQLYQNNLPLEHVQQFLGHSRPEDTLRYVDVGGGKVKDAIAAVWG